MPATHTHLPLMEKFTDEDMACHYLFLIDFNAEITTAGLVANQPTPRDKTRRAIDNRNSELVSR